MAIELSEVKKYIEENNFEGLKSYFNKNYDDIETLIPPENYINAFYKFLESDIKTLTNTYKIIELLQDHFYSDNHILQYNNSNEHKHINSLFNIYEKTLQHQPYTIEDISAATGIFDFNTNHYRKQFMLYEDQQNLRNIYKKVDSIIEKDFIYSIKYPENTNFIRKLLKIPPKQSSEDILKSFTDKLPNLLENIKREIESDFRFKDANGNLLLTQTELNQAIYERLSLKTTKQLGMETSVVNKILEDINTQKISTELENLASPSVVKSDLLSFAERINKLIKNSIPPYLIDFSKCKFPMFEVNEHGILPEAIEVYKNTIELTFQELTSDLRSQIKKYEGAPGRESISEGMLLKAVELSRYVHQHVEQKNYFNFQTPTEQQVKDLEDNLAKTQATLNQKLYDSHTNNKIKPKSDLTGFEKRGIQLINDMNSNRFLTKENSEFLSKFYEYATDNKEFNTRLGNILKKDQHGILKTNDNFIEKYYQDITSIHKFTYKTSNLKNIINTADKLENILDDIEQGHRSILSQEDKLALHDIGKINKFLQNFETIQRLSDNGIIERSKSLITLEETFNQCFELYSRLNKVLEQEVNYKSGDVVMEIAKSRRSFDLNKPDMEDKIRDFMSPYMHAAIGLKTQEGKFVSHVMKRYSKDNFEGIDSLLTESFRIYPDKLIANEDVKKQLMQSLHVEEEKDFQKELHKQYKNISINLHSSINESDGFIFSKDRGKKAFLADLIPFGLGHKNEKSVRGWAEKVIVEKENMAQKIKDPNGDGYIICSEFAAKMTVLALVELEKQLLEKMKENNPSFKPSQGQLFEMPFNEYEDLRKIHPARLIKELSKSGAIEKVPEPEIVKNIIRSR